MTVPYTFANATGNIQLSELDINFANVKAAADTAGTVTVNAQPNITSVGTLTSLSVSGNITAGNIIGAFVGNISNAVYANTAGTATTANTVTANAQPNITSVGTLTSLSVTETINAGNLSVTGSIIGTASLAIFANIAGVTEFANTAESVIGNDQPNINTVGTLYDLNVFTDTNSGNLLTGGIVSAVGNITGNYFIGNGSLLTGVTGSGGGATGPQGATGPDGATGPQGATGPAGASVQIIGSVPTVGVDPQATLNAAFPGAVAGNGVIDQNTNDLWVYDGAIWNNVGSIEGPQGATGPAGATGAEGATGPQGATGAEGATGVQGATGEQGSTGPQGATGLFPNSLSANINGQGYSIGNISFVSTSDLVTTSGNVVGNNLISNGNIATLSSVKRVIHVANTAPSSGDGAVGDIWYQYSDV